MKTAKIISIVGHPIFHPTWMMIILLLTGITQFNHSNDWKLLGITFTITCLIPAIVILLMKRWHLINSIEMEERDDRPAPLFIMVLFLYTTLTLFNKINDFKIYSFYLTSVIVVTALAFIISFFWKISLHTLGWGNLVACLFIMTKASMQTYFCYFIASILLAGIVAAARLKLKSHDSTQIYAGFAMGFATVIILYSFLA